MISVGVRDLQRNTSKIIDEISKTGRPVLVTNHGRPTVAIYAISEDGLEDWLLSNAPVFVESFRGADADLQMGRTESADNVFASIETELDEE
jgi:prevent-host-death family protein